MRPILFLIVICPYLAWGSILTTGPSDDEARVGQKGVALSCELTNTHERVRKCGFVGPNGEAYMVEGNEVIGAGGKVAEGLAVGKGKAGRSCSLKIDVLHEKHFGK